MTHFPIFFSIASLAQGQSYDCPNASEAILKNMGKIVLYLNTTIHDKKRQLCEYFMAWWRHNLCGESIGY